MPRRSRVLAVIVALATAVACAGCGLGPGAGSAAVNVRVSEDFGAHTLHEVDAGRIAGHPSDLSVVSRSESVTPSGASVRTVAGHSASGAARWFFFVNGMAAVKAPGSTKVYRGDHIWLDLHDAQATQTVPAVVGSFPEPFADGSGGRRYPSTISWGGSGSNSGAKPEAAVVVQNEFRRLHIPLSPAAPGYGANDVLSVNVGTWHQLYAEVAAQLLRYGPGSSGVYAHFTAGGHTIDLEDASGAVVKRLGPGSGLVAAIASSQDPVPTWLVIGTDRAGELAAARAVTPQALDGHFALAVRGSHRYPVPLPGGS